MALKRWILTLSMMLILTARTLGQAPEPIMTRPMEVIERPGVYPGLVELPPSGGEGRTWVRAEYLFGWIQGANLPPLVTTSPLGTARVEAGVPGPATTLFGGGPVNEGLRSGFRLEAGWLFSPERALSLEAGFMLLGSQATRFAASSEDGSTILARPFLNVAGTPAAALISFPGVTTGSIDVHASSSNFYEGHLDIAERSYENGSLRMFSLVGYRAYRLDDSLRISQRTSPTDPNFAAGTQITAADSFSTKNEFHGLDLGVRTQFVRQNWTLDVTTKVAVGRMFRDIIIDGFQTVTVPNTATVTNPGNLFALSSNIGSRSLADWRVMPEFGLAGSWQVRPNMRLRAGYSVLVLSGVSRASDQIDLVVNQNLLPPANTALGTPARPAFRGDHSDVWVQTLNFGVEFVY